jgi:hypothetical protein
MHSTRRITQKKNSGRRLGAARSKGPSLGWVIWMPAVPLPNHVVLNR